MRNAKTFPIILLNGRPAAGKSEVIDYLKKISVNERIERFHIGEFEEIDDFCMLWERFEDDDIYEKYGKERVYTNRTFTYKGKEYPGYSFKEHFFWNFLIEKINNVYKTKLRDDSSFHDNKTAIIEFSRGSEHGGFKTAYNYFSDEILKKAATLYIKCSWEESLRKNRRRFNPDKPHSVLEHGLEDIKLEWLYKDSDWDEFKSKSETHLLVKNYKIPYVEFINEPEITNQSDKLGSHLEDVCNKLWKVYNV